MSGNKKKVNCKVKKNSGYTTKYIYNDGNFLKINIYIYVSFIWSTYKFVYMLHMNMFV